MRNRILSMTSLLFFLVLSALGFAANTPPSNDEIQNWWHGEEMKIEGKPLQIGLRNKEVAYIVPVGFYHRGRNFIWHSVLVRPALKEVSEIDHPVGHECVVHDLDNNGVSEIETISLGSGGGTTIGAKSIVQFNGENPIVLHQREFNENLGCCGPPSCCCGQCVSKEINWKFVDLDGDGNDDLLEEIVIKKGPLPNNLKSRTTTYRYLFKNNAFIKIEDNGKPK